MIGIGILGADGRMGKRVQQLLSSEFSTIAVFQDFTQGCLQCDVLIDFSSPELVLKTLHEAPAESARLPALVVGSTGWKPDQLKQLETFARKIRVLMSSNFSTGLFSFLECVRDQSRALAARGYRVRVVETHHIHKKDAPSGTAIMIRDVLSQVFDPVPIESIRSGEVVGDHEVIFEGVGDRIIFKHSAMDRSLFARGALECAIWLVGQEKPPGKILGMSDFFDS